MNEGCNPTEETKKSWDLYLGEFRKNMYPVFNEYGFTMAEAFIIWKLNLIDNNVVDVENAVKELAELDNDVESDDKEDWMK